MNKFLQTTLITAVLSTGAMAGEDTGALPKTIESKEKTISVINDKLTIDSGSLNQSFNDAIIAAPKGEIELKVSDTSASKLIIPQHKILVLKGGKIVYDGKGSEKPQISLDGELKLFMDDSNAIYPTLDLPDVSIEGHWRHFDTAENINPDYVTLNVTEKIQSNEGDITLAVGSDDKNYINNKNNTYMFRAILNSQTSVQKDAEQEINLAIDTENTQKTYSIKYIINENDGIGITIGEKDYKLTNNLVIHYLDLLDGSKKELYIFIIKREAEKYDIYFANPTDSLIFGGVFNMLKLREIPDNVSDINKLKTTFELNTINLNMSPVIWSIGLPFNCKFNELKLNKIAGYPIKNKNEIALADGGIYYTVLKETVNAPVIKTLQIYDTTFENVIGKKDTENTYGDYLEDQTLGVEIADPKQVCAITKERKTTENLNLSHEYPDLGVNSENASAYYLDTNDLDIAEQEISEDIKYSFAFVGENPISISVPKENSYKAIFEGDNSKYTPADNSLTLPTEVEFGGNNSLFPITQTYGHGTFAVSDDELNNEVPSGKTITFKKGVNLEKGHILTVKGTLII